MDRAQGWSAVPPEGCDGHSTRDKEAACPTLRFCDLLVFARDCDWIDEATCESARSQLLAKKEYLPFALRSRDSFATARRSLSCRISRTPLALPTSTPDSQLHLAQQELDVAASCVDCGRCSDRCPANHVKRPLSPRFISIKARDLCFERYPIFGKPATDPVPLIGGIYSADEIWSVHHVRRMRGGVPRRH